MSEKNEWKPIESAPKTGRTLLLGYWNSNGNWRTVRGQWMSADYIAEFWEEPDDVEEGWFETAVEADDVPNCWPVTPSHWQPVPAAPGSPASTVATEGEKDERVHKNGFGSVSFTLSDGFTVSCEWSPSEWGVSIPAKRLDRDVAFKELLQEIGRLRAAASAPAAGGALADPALQKQFGEAITGALGFGAQGVNPPPEGHWLAPFWNMARADAALAAASALNAVRYRWLRDESWAGYNQAKRRPQVAETIVFIADGAGNVRTILAEEALDAAVDAAIAQQSQRKEA